MKIEISSQWTLLIKITGKAFFPIFLGVMIYFLIFTPYHRAATMFITLIILFILFCAELVWKLAKVDIDDEYIYIKSLSKTKTIELSKIKSVNYHFIRNWPSLFFNQDSLIVVRFSEKTSAGKKIYIMPASMDYGWKMKFKDKTVLNFLKYKINNYKISNQL